MNKRQIVNEINRLMREIARLRMNLHHPNTLSGFELILRKIESCRIQQVDLERMLRYPLQVTTETMTKVKKVNKLKTAKTAKAKKTVKKGKKASK